MLPIKPGTPGRTPSLFDKCMHLVILRAMQNTRDQRLYVPSEGRGSHYDGGVLQLIILGVHQCIC